MKRKFLKLSLVLLIALSCSILSACGTVTPCAWVKLNNDGYVIYTSHMYPSGGGHIYLYGSSEEAENDTYHSNMYLQIDFYPRILGADTINGERTTTVDISSGYSMKIYVYKDNPLYSPSKKIYLNDMELNPTDTYESTYFVSYMFENFELVRGNPNGKINNFVNVIEYR